ncbi:MAG: M2 family metallopeptidase, partial [Deltaproteobacteria bacterium]|nr:M2 family metallopeptidase [Deltaproteobacteria bacterium]
KPSADDARSFVEAANARLEALGVRAARAEWVKANFITVDTEALAAEAYENYIAASVELAKQAAQFNGVETDAETRRQLELLKRAITMPAPSDRALTQELTQIAAGMDSNYGKAQYCPEGAEGEDCLDIIEIRAITAESRDPAALLDVWIGWRTTSPAIRDDYRRFVELTNQGAQELGYPDTGALWRSNYDMSPDAFAAEVDRLWQQVLPLYESLHCFVRAKLAEFYGEDQVPLDQPIPAHLLGNMWAQDWTNIYDLVAPDDADPGYDLTALVQKAGYDPLGMVRSGENFFSSIGFEPLPDSFWERSLFTKPQDREVVCHASAWDVEDGDDLRIKMCIEVNAEDFQTIHHELGHNYYQRAYKDQPYLFRGSANDGFHEAIGDAIALSVTPAYLVELGLLDAEPPPSKDVGLLLRDALGKVAFLPFGILVDQWRWGVFSGEIPADAYNAGWWALREKYQGIRPPDERGEDLFDPGAKYHIPGNTPYSRYFLAAILQFQFHRAMCEIAGHEGPLNRCTIYGSKEAGRRLNEMLEMGMSRPWPDALEALTGEREADATAIRDYFAPLQAWLDEKNASRSCGW